MDGLHVRLQRKPSNFYDVLVEWKAAPSSILFLTNMTLQSDKVHRSSYGLYADLTPIFVQGMLCTAVPGVRLVKPSNK
jgi:hypothetical protein